MRPCLHLVGNFVHLVMNISGHSRLSNEVLTQLIMHDDNDMISFMKMTEIYRASQSIPCRAPPLERHDMGVADLISA